jgi:selT/selW/selH-like putative selenoprotein
VEIFGGRAGAFEITAGDDLLFSKFADHRFPEDDELRRLLDGR